MVSLYTEYMAACATLSKSKMRNKIASLFVRTNNHNSTIKEIKTTICYFAFLIKNNQLFLLINLIQSPGKFFIFYFSPLIFVFFFIYMHSFKNLIQSSNFSISIVVEMDQVGLTPTTNWTNMNRIDNFLLLHVQIFL